MRPFPIRNIDGLKNAYTDELYYYYPRPNCSATTPTCGSNYIYCDTRTYRFDPFSFKKFPKIFRCLSKIRAGGNCTGFEGKDICANGLCDVTGKCAPDNGATTNTSSVPVRNLDNL